MANDNMEGIEGAIRYKSRDLGLEVEENPERDIIEVGEYIGGPMLLRVKEDQDSPYLIVCEYDRSPSQLHLHYVRDGRLVYLSDSSHAKDVREFTRSKVKRYNELSAEKKDVLPVLKQNVALLGAIGAPQVISLLTFFGVQPNSQMVTNNMIGVLVVSPLIGTGAFVYMMLPVVVFWRFS